MNNEIKNNQEKAKKPNYARRRLGAMVLATSVAAGSVGVAHVAAHNWAEKAKFEQHELQTTQEQMHHQDLIDKVSQDVGTDPRAASEQYLSEQSQPENP